jgi:hypothetical protein
MLAARARASTKGTGLKSLRAELCQMRNFAHQCNASFPVVTVRKDKIQHVARRWSQDTERMQVKHNSWVSWAVVH